ncbi:hypothetical protein [uncultured Fluviicola sp.]|uniref:hypothetical protein n=1 Tax=uncultured Fluviicola sp. TaxID=463303 RepID=UPI0025FB16A8|nr:hypothetical protein [uncultured Fluviicola sp.]
MNLKKGILLGVTSGIVASGVSMLYNKVYSDAFYIDFHTVLNASGMIMACMIGCILMALGYVIAARLKRPLLIPILNVLYCMLSFASIIGVLSFKLPLDVEFPEMFPGLAVPMHFFPALSFLALVPFFWKHESRN